jgi:beta-lactamase regulating signal transducer with metallopeptidase domain
MIAHLWQSTWIAAAVALLTLAFRGNRARVRYGLWLCASLKFLVPFALFISLGSQLAPRSVTAPIAPAAVERIALTLAAPAPFTLAAPTPTVRDWKPAAVAGAWLAGFAAILLMRLRGWRRVRAALRASAPLPIPAAVEIRCAPGLLEPGVVGLRRPVLLLPEGIVERLTPTQLQAVLAHEVCHVRRRDNLWTSLHMLVEAVFWFHPLVWWIGARMVEERERACDEGVLSLGNEPGAYAEAILAICKLYVESPLACVSGVTGADLKKRIEAIMNNRIGLGLNLTKKLLLASAGAAALAAPIAIGVLIGAGHAPVLHARPAAPPAAVAPVPPAPQRTPPPTPAPATAPQAERMLAMLFDCGSMTPDDQERARQAAIQFVQTKMQAGDLMTVMIATSGKLAVAQDFTADQASLIAAISGAGTSISSSGQSQLATLEQAARMLGAVPGKKMLLYFSSGGVPQGSVAQAQLQHAIDTGLLSNVAFYPIDTRGVALGMKGAAMNRTYARYGKPDQIEDRGSGEIIWRYNYLDAFHGRAEFEFPVGASKGPGAVNILWPPPVTFQGIPETSPLPSGHHLEMRTYPAGEHQLLSVPLDDLTGKIDITGEVRRAADTSATANVRDSVTIGERARPGMYYAFFTLDAGSYVANVQVREQATGRTFTETIRFEVK